MIKSDSHGSYDTDEVSACLRCREHSESDEPFSLGFCYIRNTMGESVVRHLDFQGYALGCKWFTWNGRKISESAYQKVMKDEELEKSVLKKLNLERFLDK